MVPFLAFCRDVTDAAGGTALPHMGITIAADSLSLPANLGSENGSMRERNMETKPKKVQTDLFGLYVVCFGFHPVAFVNQ